MASDPGSTDGHALGIDKLGNAAAATQNGGSGNRKTSKGHHKTSTQRQSSANEASADQKTTKWTEHVWSEYKSASLEFPKLVTSHVWSEYKSTSLDFPCPDVFWTPIIFF